MKLFEYVKGKLKSLLSIQTKPRLCQEKEFCDKSQEIRNKRTKMNEFQNKSTIVPKPSFDLHLSHGGIKQCSDVVSAQWNNNGRSFHIKICLTEPPMNEKRVILAVCDYLTTS